LPFSVDLQGNTGVKDIVIPASTFILGIEIHSGGRDFLHVLQVLSSVLCLSSNPRMFRQIHIDFLYLFCFPGEDQPKGDDSTRVDEAEV
jgi:hypothetical protein